MKISYVFDASPRILTGTRVKAGFHCHSSNSDGGLTPEETIRRYRQLGYHCVGITDHKRLTPIESYSDDDFVAVNSLENGGVPDIIGVNVGHAVPEDLTLSERAARLAEQGGFTIAAHPTYEAATPSIFVSCPHLMAMEIYNAYCDGAYANGYATELWDMVLGQGKRILGVASDDAHLNPKKRFYSDAGRGWVEIWARDFSREAILEALKRGDFFSTQGPKFKTIEVTSDTIRIESTPVVQIRWRTFGHVGFVDHALKGSTITGSSLPKWFVPNIFVRIELIDQHGKKAWSNPFYILEE